MKAPLSEQTAVPDTFCLLFVNNFYYFGSSARRAEKIARKASAYSFVDDLRSTAAS
jgi:hypothetical protein